MGTFESRYGSEGGSGKRGGSGVMRSALQRGAAVAAREDGSDCSTVMKKRRKGRAAWAGMAGGGGREERQQQPGNRATRTWLGSGYSSGRAMAKGWRGRRLWRQHEECPTVVVAESKGGSDRGSVGGEREMVAGGKSRGGRRGDGSGWERLLQRRGGSDYVAARRAASDGCAWSRKDSDGRWEEAAGMLTFGVAAAAGEMGIWWLAAAGRRGIEVASGGRGDRGRGQQQCAAIVVGEEERKRAGNR
ncbi:hypothetical protein BHE74_00006639 [Ensete ventricosum]|nr:hypothetical protein BHE74_00006639 [Ensete ventricosum]